MNNLRRKRKSDTRNEDETVKKVNDEPIIVSSYFSNNETNVSSELLNVASSLNSNINNLKFSNPIKYIYNPTVYAYDPFKKYIEKYGSTEKHILFIGMNPGPFGMSQTGVSVNKIECTSILFSISFHCKNQIRYRSVK